MFKLLLIGTSSWAIIGGALLPGYLILASLIIGLNAFDNPSELVSIWLWMVLLHALLGLVWSLLFSLPVCCFGSFFLKINRWKWLRATGAVLGGITGYTLAPQDPQLSFRIAGILWFLAEGALLGSWLAVIIAQRAVEGPFIVGVRFPNAFKAMVIFVFVGVIVWLISGALGIPIILGYAFKTTHFPEEVLYRAMLTGIELVAIMGVIYGFVSFVIMTWALSPRQIHYQVPTFEGVKDYAEIRGIHHSIMTAIIMWVIFGAWIGSTLVDSSMLFGAFIGGLVGFGAGGGTPFAMDIIRRTLLFPQL